MRIREIQANSLVFIMSDMSVLFRLKGLLRYILYILLVLSPKRLPRIPSFMSCNVLLPFWLFLHWLYGGFGPFFHTKAQLCLAGQKAALTQLHDQHIFIGHGNGGLETSQPARLEPKPPTSYARKIIYYTAKWADFALPDSQDCVIGDHYMHPEHAFEMSFPGVLEKRTRALNLMKCCEGTAQLCRESSTSGYALEKILDIQHLILPIPGLPIPGAV